MNYKDILSEIIDFRLIKIIKLDGKKIIITGTHEDEIKFLKKIKTKILYIYELFTSEINRNIYIITINRIETIDDILVFQFRKAKQIKTRTNSFIIIDETYYKKPKNTLKRIEYKIYDYKAPSLKYISIISDDKLHSLDYCCILPFIKTNHDLNVFTNKECLLLTQ